MLIVNPAIKGISEVDYSWQSAGAHPKMETCYSCHNDKTVASNACESCHISTANLKPQDHQVVSFAKMHKFAALEFNANCVMCHDNQSCEDCHVATTGITETNTLKMISINHIIQVILLMVQKFRQSIVCMNLTTDSHTE